MSNATATLPVEKYPPEPAPDCIALMSHVNRKRSDLGGVYQFIEASARLAPDDATRARWMAKLESIGREINDLEANVRGFIQTANARSVATAPQGWPG